MVVGAVVEGTVVAGVVAQVETTVGARVSSAVVEVAMVMIAVVAAATVVVAMVAVEAMVALIESRVKFMVGARQTLANKNTPKKCTHSSSLLSDNLEIRFGHRCPYLRRPIKLCIFTVHVA